MDTESESTDQRNPSGQAVIDLAIDHGFALAGIATLEQTEWRHELRAWLQDGKHGEMGWLSEHTHLRENPIGLLERGAKSALMVADLYAVRTRDPIETLADGHGRIARYARGKDYHKVVKKRLHALADLARERFGGQWRAFVDTAPVLERELAQRAGLGWIGKHTLLIHPRAGSWMLIGGIATDLELERPQGQGREPDHCGSCTRCIDACPTQAITPRSVDATKCIAYLTIEHRSPIDPSLHEGIGDWIFGCDVCQEVCPHNSVRDALEDRYAQPNEAYTPRASSFDLLEVLGWDEDQRRTRVSGTPMTRAKLNMFKRNAMIAAFNDPSLRQDDRVRQAAEQFVHDDDPLLSRSARDVLA